MVTESTTQEWVPEAIAAYQHDDRFWLLLSVGIGSVIVWLYYGTHPYPAYGGGLYLEIVEQLVSNDFRPPHTIERYTAEGIPFAYPPLLFYCYAVLGRHGVDLLELLRVLPGVITIAALVPYHYLGRELLDSTRTAGVGTVAYTVIPVATQWHITGGGMVRAPALLFTLAGLYCCVRLFDGATLRFLLPATVLFGLTVLSHPQYATLFAVSTLLFYLAFDRSRQGLLGGVTVALGGLLIASPWWVRVVTTYGVGPLTSAASTHGGVINSPAVVLGELIGPLGGWPAMAGVHLLLLIGIAHALFRRRWFVPAWLFVVLGYSAAPRYLFIPGALLIGAVVVECLPAVVQRLRANPWHSRRSLAASLALLIVTGACAVGAVGGIVGAPTGYAPYISENDVSAMTWVRNNTDADAQFVVVGDVADWFPYFADRTSLVSLWGAEWRSGQYSRHMTITEALVSCRTAGCLTDVRQQYGLTPEYLYIPNGRVTGGGADYRQPPSMRRSLQDSPRYTIVHENADVLVVACTSPRSTTVAE